MVYGKKSFIRTIFEIMVALNALNARKCFFLVIELLSYRLVLLTRPIVLAVFCFQNFVHVHVRFLAL